VLEPQVMNLPSSARLITLVAIALCILAVVVAIASR
jgi:hypothetical protein